LTVIDAGTSTKLTPLKGAAGALYGTTSDFVIYVVNPGPTALTASKAKVIRKGTGVAELFDANLTDGTWVIEAKADVLGPSTTVAPVVVPAECADLTACLKLTPLDKCAAQAVACTATVASGSKLEHGDKKVDLFTLGLAEAVFGSDTRGVFVVSVSKDDAKKGTRLFVATGKAASVVDVEYDEDKQTWREPKGTNWILIGILIGGGVAALIIIAVVVYLLSRPQPAAIGFAPMPPMPPM
jgi:hypothetical protein